MDVCSLLETVLGAILNYKRDPYVTTVKGIQGRALEWVYSGGSWEYNGRMSRDNFPGTDEPEKS